MIYGNFTITDKLGDLATYQDGLFTTEHKKFNLTLTIQNNKTGEKSTKRTAYQFAPKYTKFKENDGILAIVSDALAYANSANFEHFCAEFGYYKNDPIIDARKCFTECKNAYSFFLKAGLSEEDLCAIQEILDV